MTTNSILNIDICSISLNDFLINLKKGVVFTPNVDHLVKLQKNQDFFYAYKDADWIICDSKVVNLGAKFLGKPFVEVIPGSSFLPAFYNYHKNNNEIKLFLLGAAEGVAEKAKRRINQKINREIVTGAFSPSFGFENNEEECNYIIDVIRNSGANVLVVGVGAPKQELWIAKYKHLLPEIDIFLALGATIDFEAENIKRAPEILQKLHLEWLYRLLCEPRRLWKRYLIDDMPFFFLILKQKLGLYKKPF
ncbi:MAG: WecB/TagA/CpsF family glycosyltransferase [Taibaiella sp.]|jgi:exopolysaccharide biosynthesis WecB/TagA/CpsF family protein